MFWKKDKKEEKKVETPRPATEIVLPFGKREPVPSAQHEVNFDTRTLKGFYISEKATALSSFGQYVFKVFDNATKNEVRKQVEKSFSVKVKGVKIINLPRKSRTIGRHSGFKKGFKKAIVALEKGYTIDQAKA